MPYQLGHTGGISKFCDLLAIPSIRLAAQLLWSSANTEAIWRLPTETIVTHALERLK